MSQVSVAQATNNANDAGDKMASVSTTPNGITRQQFKVMDVDCIIEEEQLPPDVIELADGNDDVDIDSVLPSDVIKTELDHPEQQLIDKSTPNGRSYHGADPMGLLECMGTKHIDIDDDDDIEDDSEEELSNNGSRRLSHAQRWDRWMKRLPWLLHDDSDGDLAFCLYCNISINGNRSLKVLHQHNLSLYHQERENNYEAFRKSLDPDNDAEIKHEFGSREYVAAMKKRRNEEVQQLNDFNWERWLKWHWWLERIQPHGSIGLCKCCNVRMNVEFEYLRKRHEMSKGHADAERIHNNNGANGRKRKRSASQDGADQVDTSTDAKKLSLHLDVPDPNEFCEMIPNTAPQQCRCTLCDCRMVLSSFLRHLRCKSHCGKLLIYRQNQQNINRGIWAQYADLHPWLVADPQDPTQAYCHICAKRFMYGHSELKRKAHEGSEKHLTAMKAAMATSMESNTIVGMQPEPVDNSQMNPLTAISANEKNNMEDDIMDEEENDYDAYDGAGVETETEGEHSDDDYIQEDDKLSTSQNESDGPTGSVSWSQKMPHVIRDFEWLQWTKDRKCSFCRLCRVRLKNLSSMLRHEKTLRHITFWQQFKDKTGIIGKVEPVHPPSKIEPVDKTEENGHQVHDSTSMQAKVMRWKNRYPWISYKRTEKRLNYGWCKLCEVSVFMPSSKFASRHQRSSRHIRLRMERKKLGIKPKTEIGLLASATASAMVSGEDKHKAAIAQLQTKYSWLEAEPKDENYCHCKVCDSRVPIKVFYLRQHDASRKHVENLSKYMSTAVVNTTTEAAATETPKTQEEQQKQQQNQPTKDTEERYSDELDSGNFRSDCSTEDQQSSKRSRRSMEVHRVLRALRESMGRRQEERSQLEVAKDMICSSFDIVTRLRNLERENEIRDRDTLATLQRHSLATPGHAPLPPQRDTIDLFFDSIVQTMKHLPADLAAEGKSKIMQIVCNLELRSFQRSTVAATPSSSTDTVRSSTVGTQELSSYDLALDTPSATPDSEAIVIDDVVEKSRTKRSLSNLKEITVLPSSRTNNNSSSNNNNPAQSGVIANVRTVEVSPKIQGIVPGTVLVAPNLDCMEHVRVVPLSKLTRKSRSNSTAGLTNSGEPEIVQQANKSAATPPVNPATTLDLTNDNKIRTFKKISSSNIVIQKSPLSQTQQGTTTATIQQKQIYKVPARFAAVTPAGAASPQIVPNNNNNNSNMKNTLLSSAQMAAVQAQVHAQAQAQIRKNADAAKRQMNRAVPSPTRP